MIILVFGEDGFRAKRKVEGLVSAFRGKHDPSGMNVARFDFEDNAAEVKSALGTIPFLAKRRLIVIRGLATAVTKKDEAAEWAKVLAGRGEETIAILFDDTPKEKAATNKLFMALREVEKVHEYVFGTMTEKEAVAWIVGEGKVMGVAWEPTAAKALFDRVGDNPWRLASEFEKVSFGSNGSVAAEDVKQMVAEPLEDTLFALLDAVRAKQAPRATTLLRNELTRGTEPGLLLNLLAKDVRTLVELWALRNIEGKEGEARAPATLGLHPFVVKKTLPRVLALRENELSRMMSAVTDADRAVKTGEKTDRAALEELVLNLLLPVQ